MKSQNIQAGQMAGQMASVTGGLSEKRVINYTSRYFAIPVEEVRFQALTPDASTRKYYRVFSGADSTETLIISLYLAPFNAHENSFVDVSRLFERAGLPAPRIIDVADTDGIILQEDLGDTSLAKWLCDASDCGDARGAEAIKVDLQAIAAELAARPRSLTHRDYHGMNLMVDAWGALRIIDHQDARIEPTTY